MLFIRQNATHKVVVGPAVDVTDAVTPETGVTLASADEAEAILHDNGTVVDISGYTWAAITNADGYYHLTLQSGITGTVGHLTILVNDDDLMLPLKQDFMVIEEAVYDKYYASSADADTSTLSDIKSQLVVVNSETTQLQSVTTVLLSDTTAIHSQTTVVESDTTAIESRSTKILSDTTAIHSQTTVVESDTTAIHSETTRLLSDTTQIVSDIAALNDITVADILTTQMTESYAADGSAPTVTQALMMIQQMLGDFTISGTTLTVRKVDGGSTAATFNLNSATQPTDITRNS